MTTTPCARCDLAPRVGRGSYPHLCWGCTPGEDDAYPVLVEYTHRHVVWVSAYDQEAAIQSMQSEPYEKTSDQETLFESGWTVTAPTSRWDWDSVYEGGYFYPYQGLKCDAHVDEHSRHVREMQRLFLEATAEHEDREVAAGRLAQEQRRTCGLCPDWLDDAGHESSVRHQMSVRMAANRAARDADVVSR